jgi:uncharacterized membrane protein YgdD (TMEM256/DUF423 family)
MMSMTIVRWLMAIAAVLGGTGVAAGAFASHALRSRLSDRALEIFDVGTRYQLIHAVALLLVAGLLWQAEAGRSLLTAAGVSFIVGTLIFSGSLYALSLSGIKWLGAITPLGGAGFLIGWLCLLIAAFSIK